MKANQKAKFSVIDFFATGNYLDHNEVIAKIPTVKQALKDIKDRKRFEKHFLNFNNPLISQWIKDASNEQKILKPTRTNITKQIQRGFDIAEKWKDENKA